MKTLCRALALLAMLALWSHATASAQLLAIVAEPVDEPLPPPPPPSAAFVVSPACDDRFEPEPCNQLTSGGLLSVRAFHDKTAEIMPRELVFVLDTSGSMSGAPMKASKRFMKDALGGLRAGDYFRIRSTRCATQFSNNIRNNNGLLRRSRPDGVADRRDMQFMQEGRKVFKEVLPLVSQHIAGHLESDGVEAADLKRLWLHQANKSMNDFIGRKVLGRTPSPEEQPNILQDYANTSSAGSIIAFSKYSADLAAGDLGLICSFGAGYSVGSVLVERQA